jgi:hypothetical protein
LLSDPLFVELIVAVPVAEGVNVTVTPVVPFKLTVVGLKVPLTPETDGVIVAVDGPLPVNVIVTGVPTVPLALERLDEYAVADELETE